ncbi:presequence protease 1, chloroplastic/mitochondrial isoform X2 [Daucus carota subsp. sativus]|uniref:presequence protease 1, chloroplastic/mitochondrial isoform X2 n=1 Tax=Daucus carota subsp. sativus TaxID=79200 RepID=UPI0007EF7382|nr:PREDICTED: presequence protease 1, chloroplastic/mitochondrial-like isoform X2 [Daucus carota subsp. sativus]
MLRAALRRSSLPARLHSHRRSFLRQHPRLIPTAEPPPLNAHFRPLFTRSVATSAPQSSPDVYDAPEKLGFDKVSEQFIEECKSTLVLFKHKKTGAQVMSVSNDDENKVFGIVFRTPPKDSTGIPHILEHSVLCGSRKYPLKDPFVQLLKGSLHTFLGAFTHPDRTFYTVASTNAKDFYNLVDVYLDAVFFPKCVEDIQTFQQEGWHHELNDPSEDITYKGVVFNEMKGVYSQPHDILSKSAQQEFHLKFYHPSNARIWFYGDDDPIERLRILSEYLDMFDVSTAPEESIVKLQKLFLKPVRIVKKYPVTEGGVLKKKHMVCLNWLISDEPLDMESKLALLFLDHLLLGSLNSGECNVGGGAEYELLQTQFSIGWCVSKENIKRVEDLVMDTIKSLAETGFDTDAVEASMNTVEFSLRENNTGSFPRGLALMLQSIGKWIYDMDPFEPLKYQKPLLALKARIAEEGNKAVFSPLIEKYILNNPHRVTIEMQPDAEKASCDEASEKTFLDELKANMTEADLAKLDHATRQLRLRQETPDPPEALKSVPSLSLQDIPKKPIQIPIKIGDINGVKVLQHDLFTNDVLYSEVVFDMSSLKQELVPLVPLFCQSLMGTGTKDMDFVQLNQLIGRKTGGISVYPFTSSVRGKADPCSHMIVRGKAMSGHTEDLFNLINHIIQGVQFTDQKRFKRFISMSKARMEYQLQASGHKIAAARIEAKLNVAGWIGEQMGGVSYLEFLQSLEEKVNLNWNEISSSLEEIRRTLFTKSGCLINLTADGKNLTNSEKHVGKFLDLLPTSSSAKSEIWNAQLPSTSEAIVIPTQVNYVGKAVNLYETGYEFNGSAHVISKHISNTWLWDRVRVSGGAYEGYCDFDDHSGVFSFMSHCDPNLLKTLNVYDGTSDFLRELEMDDDALTKAIIGTIGDEDSYHLPDVKGYSSLVRYLMGIEEEERQKRREEILSTSLADFKEFAERMKSIKDNGVVVVVASAKDVDNAHKERPNFFEIKKAL